MNAPADAGIREQALDIHQSYAVAAPAGSGKTGLLTRRVLRLLAVCEAPEQVLAITFTRKAASEMRQRINDALQLAVRAEPPADAYQQQVWRDACAALQQDEIHNWQLLANPARLRILTIDGLCRNLARQLAVESALGQAPEPLENPEPLYRAAVRELLEELESGGEPGEAIAILLSHLDNDLNLLENLLVSLLQKREQWLQIILESRDNRELLESFLVSTIEETLVRARRSLAVVGSDIALLADYAAANLRHLNIAHPLQDCLGLDSLPEADPDGVNQWLAICDLLLTKAGDWRKSINKSTGFPTVKESIRPECASERKSQWDQLLETCREQPQLLEDLREIRHLPDSQFSDNHWRVLEALTRLLPRLAAGFALLARRQGHCDFTEITLAAISGLGNAEQPAELSLQLDHQLRHILVDEFQDTSSLQYQLLNCLVEGWQPGDGRTLFIVGDGMQSLYGFRNANVGLFLEARQQPLNQVSLQPLDLTVNFRSDPGIIDWVNRTFASVFPPVADISRGAVPYTPSAASRVSESPEPVTITVLPTDAPPVAEADEVVKLIRIARITNPEGTIAILASKRKLLHAIVAALRRANIPWQANDIDSLATRMPIIDLLSLTRALFNPADRIAWLSVLRAPWAGLDLNDLYSIASTEVEENPKARDENMPWLPGQVFSSGAWASLSTDGQRIMKRIAPVLETALAQKGRKPVRMYVEGVWLALGGPAALADPSYIAWCQQFFDLLEQQAGASGLPDLREFEDALQRLYAAPVTDDDNPVQLMTIHKAKGLEFDTVIIPGLGKGGRPADAELLYWRQRIDQQGNLQLLLSPPVATGEDQSALVRHLKREAGLKQRLEDARAIYVACTRARANLHLLFNEPAEEPGSHSLLARLWPALATELEDPGSGLHVRRVVLPYTEHVVNEGIGPTIEEEVLAHLVRLPTDWEMPSPQASSTTSTAAAPGYTGGREVRKDTADEDPTLRHMGTVLHRTLKQVVSEGPEQWNGIRLDKQQSVWRTQLRQLGVAEVEPALVLLRKAVETMSASDVGRWLLDPAHEQSACELPLYSVENNCTTGSGNMVNKMNGADTPGDFAPGSPAPVNIPTVKIARAGDARLSIIDRTFVDQGIRWIIDYKMSEPSPGQSRDAFLAEQQRLHGAQLARYSALFAALAKEPWPATASPTLPIRTALYFPLIDQLQLVDIQYL